MALDNLARLDLNKLHAFLVVGDAGGVSAAARRLALTRSAVSQAVAGLEAALGVRLFHRVGRRLSPTREGELLHRRLAEYQAMLARTIDEVVNERGDVAGAVRIGVYLGFPRPILARLLARLVARHPAARPQVLYGAQEELRERLVAGRLDVAFSLRPSRSARREVRSTPLFEQELVLVASRRHFRGGLGLADLERTPVVDYYRGDPLVARWLEHHADALGAGGRASGTPARGRARRATPDVRVFGATTDVVLELVLAGVGVAVLPRPLVQPHLARRRLFAISPGPTELSDTVWLDELRSAAESRSARALRRTILDEAVPETARPLAG